MVRNPVSSLSPILSTIFLRVSTTSSARSFVRVMRFIGTGFGRLLHIKESIQTWDQTHVMYLPLLSGVPVDFFYIKKVSNSCGRFLLSCLGLSHQCPLCKHIPFRRCRPPRASCDPSLVYWCFLTPWSQRLVQG